MNKVLFPGISWFLLLLIPITFFGFYPSYFSKLFTTGTVFHVHAFFMLLWIAMAILQPFLIMRKKTKLHRLIGKASYVIMPVVFITAWLVIRHVYHLQITRMEEANSAGVRSTDEIRSEAAAYIAIGIIYLGWLIIYYGLAVINRRKMLFHATYMFAAILTLLGPTADRLLYNSWQSLGWRYGFLIQNAVFLLNLLLISALLVYQWRKGNSVKPAGTVLAIYVAGLLVFFFLPGTRFWQRFVEGLL